MNQSIKTSTLLLVLFIFGGLLFAKFWASSENKSIRVFSYLHKHPDGKVFIKLNNQLFGFNNKGQYQQTIELNKLGVQEEIASDFAFFSNGDLLVRRQSRNKSLSENIQTYFRMPDQSDKTSTDRKEGLFRCNTVNAQCKAFTSPLNLDDAFSVAIDWATDRVFIADTARHQVYLFSSQGEELDSAKGFWFPNQLEVNNNKLYVADTNHHRLIALDISTDKLVKTDEEFDTRTENSRKLTEVWPSSFLLRPQQRWVINSKHDMSHGGIYIFDNDGIYSKKLHLPENADPFALLQIGQQVLITDFSLDRIYRYSLNGEYLGDFDSAILQKIQQGLTERRAHYAKLDSVFSILFAIALAGGFLLALYQQYQAQNELLAGQVSSQTAIDEPVLHWITPTNRFKALSYSMVLFVIALFCTLIVLLALHDFSLTEFFGNTWKIQLLVLILLLTSLLQLRYKIGITKNTLILHSPIKAKIVCPLNDIVFNEAFIIIGESTLRLDLLYKLFSASDIENHLYPVIKEAKQIDHIKRQTTFVTTLSAYIIQITIVCILTALFFYYGVLN